MKQIAWAEVTAANEKGYTLEASRQKIFVSAEESLGRMEKGREYLILYWEDEQSNRLIGSEKITNHLQTKVPKDKYSINQMFDGVIYQQTKLGFKVFFDGEYSGLMYEEGVYADLTKGQKKKVYIKHIREDGKIDLSIYPVHFQDAANTAQQIILAELHRQNGHLKLTDKSSPEEINKVLGLSKKKFKEAVGMLYKQRKIELLEDRIKLVWDPNSVL